MRHGAWAQLERGQTFHLIEDGSAETVCGREVGDNPRFSVYQCVGCLRCKAKDPELVEAAEVDRFARSEEHTAKQDEELEANRRGEFVVVRCKLCGLQHVGAGQGGGVPFCMAAGHVADLELVEAHGPVWKDG